jgi:hypothetical protein
MNTTYPSHEATTWGESTTVDFGLGTPPCQITSDKVYGVLAIAFVPFIIFGNSLVLVAIWTFRKLHTPQNIFVASLAMADLMVGILTLPIYALFFLYNGDALHDNKYACLTKYASVVGTLSGSLTSLTLLAIDRFISIAFPLRYRSLVTMTRAKMIAAGNATYNILNCLLPIFGLNNWDSVHTCNYFKVLPRAYTVFNSSVMVSILLLVTVILYVIIFYKASVVRQQRKIMLQVASSFSMPQFEKDTRMAKIMAFVLLLFVLCWVPFFVVASLSYQPFAGKFTTVKDGTLMLAMANSMLNPIIYGWLRTDYRKAFCALVWCRQNGEPHNTNRHSSVPSARRSRCEYSVNVVNAHAICVSHHPQSSPSTSHQPSSGPEIEYQITHL